VGTQYLVRRIVRCNDSLPSCSHDDNASTQALELNEVIELFLNLEVDACSAASWRCGAYALFEPCKYKDAVKSSAP